MADVKTIEEMDQVKRVAKYLNVLRASKRDFNHLDMSDAIKHGLPRSAALRIKKALGLSNEQVADSLGISPRTISRWSKTSNSLLNPMQSDRLYRFAAIGVLALKVMEDREIAASWLKSPQVGLGGRVPLELMKTEVGSREVESLLNRIECGVLP